LQRDLIVASGKLSDVMWSRDDAAGALTFSEQTVTQSRRLAAQDPADRSFRYFQATSLLDHGYKLFKIRGDLAGAEAEMRESIAMLESLHAADPSDPHTARTLTLGYSRVGELFEYRHYDPIALVQYVKELRLVQTLTRASPKNVDLAHLQAFAEQDLAGVLTDMGRLDEAEQHGRTALASFRSLSVSDPRIAEYHWDEGRALSSIGYLAGRRHEPQRSIALLQQALAAMNAASQDQGSDANLLFIRAHAETLLGDQYAALASSAGATGASASRLENWRAAKASYERALTAYRTLSASWFEARAEAQSIVEKLRQCDGALSV
ncbi:MAG TPA: tetratricopeptide repeat protein, partial [Steroidobacteraceae bacterium]|nr:tetratricopeptide repeat protein [Steroidobacteraceae bacterium]